MSKYLFFLHNSHASTVNGVLLDDAKSLRRSGNEVLIYFSDNFLKINNYNYLGSSKKNISEAVKQKLIFRKYFKGFDDIYSLNQIAENNGIKFKRYQFIYDSIDEIKSLKYRGVSIGYGCLSTYISKSRNLDPQIDRQFKEYFDAILFESQKLIDITYFILRDKDGFTICLYNGRFFDNRPYWEVAKNLGLDFRCYEAALSFDKTWKKNSFDNSLPHDMFAIDQKAEKAWNSPNFSEGDKIGLAKQFYELRARGKSAGDKAYTRDQTIGLLPPSFNKNKRNFVVFISSEDEVVAIGGKYEEYNLFPSQIVGIKYILDYLKDHPQIHLYIRVHPNLRNVKYRYHLDLYEFESLYDNVTVVHADSEVSTYSLLMACEKSITFNSTMGVEANYWRIPVILLSSAFWYKFEVAYKPTSYEELKGLLLNELKPLDKIGAFKYAYYFWFVENDSWKYIDFSQPKNYNLFGRKLMISSYVGLRDFIIADIIARVKTLFRNDVLFSKLPTLERI